MAFVTPAEELWLELEMPNGSTMRDQSDNPPHKEWMLYCGATSCSFQYAECIVNKY